MGAAIVLLLLPSILSVFGNAMQMVELSYKKDQIQQDVVAFIEEGKATYDSGGFPITGDRHSHFKHHPSNIDYRITMTRNDVQGINLWIYTVQAVQNGDIIYEISTYLGPPNS